MAFVIGYAQDTSSKQDLKVGLVLSGGGAKGFAHIGVLKTLEEAGVRVDYIGGTSMGAIVGALYASGYTPQQLDSIFNSVDFEYLIQDKIPRSSKSFYEKEDSEQYAITLPFNNFKVGFPSSISKGQNVYNLLARLLSPVSEINDFNKLPIPFFCMATDIETGEAVKLDHGYLPEAIQASGSFPSLFQPVEIDGRVLIDGGVVNNYPIDEVKAMGADIVIGVDVQDDLAKRDELVSAVQVLLQINNYRTVHDMYEKKGKTDVYIHPDISNFTVVSFDEGRSIIDNGEKAGKKRLEEFQAIAARQKGKRQSIDCKVKDTIELKGVSIIGHQKFSRAYVMGKLRIRNGEKIKFSDLDVGIGNLLATGNFDIVRYKLIPFEDGRYQLNVYVKENNDNTLLRLGVHYDDLYKTAGLINVTRKNLFQDDDRASLDFIIGDNTRYNFEYYVDKGFYISYGLKSAYNTFDVAVGNRLYNAYLNPRFSDLNKLNVNVVNWLNQVYFQTVFDEEFSVGVGAEHSLYKVKTENIVEGESQETYIDDSNYYSAFGYLKLDTYDNKYFPTSGLFLDGDLHMYLFSSDHTDTFETFSILKGEFGVATPVYRNLSFNMNVAGGFKFGDADLNTFNFMLGGYGNDYINNLVPFYGYDYVGIAGESYVKGTFTLDYKFLKRHHINMAANFADVGDLFEDDKWSSAPEYSGYALGYGLETFLGPMEMKYTWSPENTSGFWYFSIGYWF